MASANDGGGPLSWFQERMWLHYERSPDDTSYNLPFPLLIRGDLNVPALEKSLNAITARHESLRTLYNSTSAGEPRQFISPAEYVPLPVVPVDRDLLLEELNRFLEHRFDLRQGPIFISRLLRLPNAQHLLLLSVHHIAADAWSLKAILRSELLSAYGAFSREQIPVLPSLTVQYRQYARKQRATDSSLTAHTEYWREVLRGYEDSLELPTTYPRHPKSGARSGRFTYLYPQEFSRELERLSRDHGSTMFMCLLAALAVTVSRYADKEDLCIGTTTSNRPDVELERLIGFFVNILPLRLRIDEQCSIADLLHNVRSQVLNAFEHPVPFERILQATDVANRESRNPLVPIVMRHQNFPEALWDTDLPENITFKGFPDPDETDVGVLKLLAQEDCPARCEIELSYSGDGDRLELEVVYASDLYDRAAVERLLAHHQHVLEGMFGDVSRPLLELRLLRDSDIAELLERSARVPMMELPMHSFVDRFDDQVQRRAGGVACWDGSDRGVWSYLDLAQRSHGVAHALAERGIGTGDLVAVCLPRGGELLATLLGIWRTGAAYVPIDPAYPVAYSRSMIDDARPKTVVCDATRQALLGVDAGLCLLPEQIPDVMDTAEESIKIHPDSLAYVMYTSGSTGKPKGVRVPHRQLNNWLSALEASLPFQPGEVVGQKTTSVFAAGVKELFAGLLNGCPQVTIDDHTVRDVAAFVDVLTEHHVSRLNLLPSHLGNVMDHLRSIGQRLPALKVCTTAGEPLPKGLVLEFRELFPNAHLLNNYGCTEVNDIAYYDTANFDGTLDFVPIGTPIANTRVYVMDRHGRLVPDGVAGEMYVTSASVPDGYHGLEALTAERFPPNPFGVVPSNRLYNTGDVVRHLPSGYLDFIGRWDFQVKVRGFRVDVRQVEQVISDFEGIRARAVVGRDDRLTAFYTCVPEREVSVAELRAFLRDRLPSYMVPDTFVLLEAMPLLPNGKLNRRALLLESESNGQLQQSGEYEPPATPTERSLADIWGVVVNMPASRIGRHSHFFEIGGHSLSAMRVLARIKDTFRVELGLRELFDAPRLASLSEAIDRQTQAQRLPDDLASPGSGVTRPRGGAFGMLQDKVVLVTGGSRGIGLATSLLMAEQGAKVAINYRDSETQALSVKQMIEANGGTAEVFGADVTKGDQVAAMVAAIHDRFGRIDVLVANAHVHFRHRPFLEYEWDDLERKVSDELKAMFYPCQAVAPGMVARRSGSIIAVSSTLSKRSNEGFLAQCTAKAALDAFVRTLSAELGPHGIRVNTVAPGLTLTDAAMPMAPYVKESIAAQAPLRRNGLPEDMAGAITFLASDMSRFMTGAYMPLDGGATTL
ncbi:non-ribosomal peptide synthetase [Podospora aff. communis PSN243]|uniref:Non-ribosomal peptide synthetase n=1 Tax=Podospora aff. communis PSN243 TaxID=3040156 RepID=A0AAV9GQR6_9PEZI|nr:non-ribosomal peptide synthetase [Podospora aff. communis PSN243]